MVSNEKKIMRFWIFSGVVAVVASQLPLYMKKKQLDIQAQQKQQKRPWWIKLLFGTVIAVLIWIVFDYFT